MGHNFAFQRDNHLMPEDENNKEKVSVKWDKRRGATPPLVPTYTANVKVCMWLEDDQHRWSGRLYKEGPDNNTDLLRPRIFLWGHTHTHKSTYRKRSGLRRTMCRKEKNQIIQLGEHMQQGHCLSLFIVLGFFHHCTVKIKIVQDLLTRFL